MEKNINYGIKYEIRDGKRMPTATVLHFEILNRQAFNVWSNPKSANYECAFPKGHTSDDNWSDVIGFAIAYNKAVHARMDGIHPWEAVKEFMVMFYMPPLQTIKTDKVAEQHRKVMLWLEPYFHLIDMWRDLGYIPVSTLKEGGKDEGR